MTSAPDHETFDSPEDEPFDFGYVKHTISGGLYSQQNRRWVTALAAGAVAMMRPDDVSPKYRWVHRLGYAAAHAALTYAQSHPTTTGKDTSRDDLALVAGAGIATFVGYDWLNKVTVATDTWLERRGVSNPRALGALATAGLVGLTFLLEDLVEDDDDVDEPEPETIDLPEPVRAAISAILTGLEDRDPAAAAALHQQLASATTEVYEGEDPDEDDASCVRITIADGEATRAVPHDQTASARGRFTHDGREHEISLEVCDGLLDLVCVEDLDVDGEDDEVLTESQLGFTSTLTIHGPRFRLADWPAPAQITVVHEESS